MALSLCLAFLLAVTGAQGFQPNCSPGWWLCPGGTSSGWTCIQEHRVCDGRNDCSNGGDEQNCEGGGGGGGSGGGGGGSGGGGGGSGGGGSGGGGGGGSGGVDVCGNRYFDDYYSSPTFSEGYIVGGQAANRGSLPWQVSIQTSYGFHYCGGTVIGKRWILTAAHCFSRSSASSKDRIVAGEHKLKTSEGSEQAIGISRVIVHQAYNSRNMRNDIALLKLSQDIRFDSYTQPACVPKKDNESRDYATGDTVIVSGWGRLSSGGTSPRTLQMVKVPFISDQTCNKRGVYGGQILSSMICAGKLEGGKDSCQGDSGGPLVKKVYGKWTVLGVVSWGVGCAGYNKPGVYTRVARFDDWIQDTIANH